MTAGGTQVRVWDLLAGGREIACLANHQKTVTSLAVSGYTGPTSSAGPRLLTGSLDSHLKVGGRACDLEGAGSLFVVGADMCLTLGTHT